MCKDYLFVQSMYYLIVFKIYIIHRLAILNFPFNKKMSIYSMCEYYKNSEKLQDNVFN